MMKNQTTFFEKLNGIFWFLAFSLLIFTINASAQVSGNSDGITINVVSTTPSGTTLEFNLNDYKTNVVKIDGKDYADYIVPGSNCFMEKGMPQLPIHRVSIIIPDLAGMNYRVISQEFRTVETLDIMPSKGHITRDIDPNTVPYSFNDFYTRNEWFPQTNINLDNPYIVRELRGLTVQFNPMQYNPAERKLKICSKLVVEVYSDPNKEAINTFNRVKPFEGVTREFIDIYKSLFVNYGKTFYDYVPLEETGRLLIIYPTAFAGNITPFYDWKVEKGIPTLLAEYPTETGSGSAAIKDYIQNLYDSPDGLTFIVLVGEANQIPTLYGQYEGAPSDPCYVKLAGTDAYPDAFISRISPTSSTNLDYVLYKLVKYEKYPDTGQNAAWYLEGTGVASNEGSPADWERCDLLRDMLMNDMHFTTVDQIYDPGATKAQVTNALNDGRSILNYIGHGSGISWGTTGFGNSDIYNLSNGFKDPFIIDVACDNGDFTMSECMEEAWVRAGDMQNPKGAVGSFGASTLASWVPPCDMQHEAIYLLTSKQMHTVGGLCFNGIMHAMDLWGGSTGEGLKLMEQYNIMGDCSMALTLGLIPDSTAPEQITDLNALDPTSNSITLNWTSPFDSSYGGIYTYDLRHSLTPIVTEEDFENAPSVLIAGEPDSSGMSKSYLLKNLDFSSTYYLAMKALDIWGNASIMSNTTNQTTWIAPEIQVTPDSIYCQLPPDTTYVDSVLISNITNENSTLDYSIELANNIFPNGIRANIIQVSKENTAGYNKANPDIRKGTSQRGSGGPDNFGYSWIDSNEPEGPEFVWNEISSTGTLVTNWIPTSIYTGADEGKAGPFDLGFDFKYYGIEYNQVWFCSNGFVSFFDITDAAMTNENIPSADIPNAFIAAVWDDLDGGSTGHVYYQQESDRFIVEYKDWPGFSGGVGPFTFQIILYKNGKIMIYYNTISGSSNSATVGIENHDGTDGLQVAYNATYLQSNLALQFSAEPEWVLLNNFEGTIYNGNTVALVLNIVTQDLQEGEYSIDMIVSSNDPVTPQFTVPIHMTVSSVPVELSSFTAECNQDEVLLRWQTATETNNKGFEIQRAIVPENGEVTKWEKLTFLNGAGTSTKPNNYFFKDKIEKAGKFKYRIKQIDLDGTSAFSKAIEVKITGPKDYCLYQNYPNPFNPSTTIKFALPVKTRLRLTIYNSIGEKVKELFNGELDAGYHEMNFNASGLASGIYFYNFESENFVQTKKLILLK
jgi:Peptidase family C25/Propeptide_C25/Secretion system C-terminal sorting domain